MAVMQMMEIEFNTHLKQNIQFVTSATNRNNVHSMVMLNKVIPVFKYLYRFH